MVQTDRNKNAVIWTKRQPKGQKQREGTNAKTPQLEAELRAREAAGTVNYQYLINNLEGRCGAG